MPSWTGAYNLNRSNLLGGDVIYNSGINAAKYSLFGKQVFSMISIQQKLFHDYLIFFIKIISKYNRFNVNRLDEVDQFSLNVGVTLDVDGDLFAYPLLDDLLIPIPGCYRNALLPGKSTISNLLQQMGGNIGSIGIDVVLRTLGLQVCMQVSIFMSCQVIGHF